MIKSISSNSSKDAKFTFAPSVQSDLFNYLKPAQRKAIRPFLQIIKRPWQEKLCVSLMDYLEGNGLNPISQPVLRFLQNQIIEECALHPLTSPHAVIKPLYPAKESTTTPHCGLDPQSQEIPHQVRNEDRGVRNEVHQPKSIGTLIKQLFPCFSNRSNI